VSHIDELNLDFYNFTRDLLKGYITFHEVGINVNFECQENFIWNTDRKNGNFTIALTLVGLVHLYYTLTLIREILLNRVDAKSVK
jgi:hypothetical protein